MDAVARLSKRGRALWDSTNERHPGMTEAEREVLLEACRICDRLERLDEVLCRRQELIMETATGAVAHPALVEARQQQNILKQLVASLRIPDASTGARPNRAVARGAYQPKNAGSAPTLRDRLRAA